MARYRLHHSLPRRTVIRRLHRWTKKYLSDENYRPHQKLTDAKLVAYLLARFVYRHPYPSVWWSMLKADWDSLPSYTQAYKRGIALLEKLETLAQTARKCSEVIIDSMPLPVCRSKRAKHSRFKGAKWGYGTQGKFYGYKLHAWVTPEGSIVQYALRPANLHDVTVGYELNVRWPDYGGPTLIGDKGYCALGYIFPPKKNTRYDTGWRQEVHGRKRKRIETVFSQLVEVGVRGTQAKTLPSLRLRVVLAVLAHNLVHP